MSVSYHGISLSKLTIKLNMIEYLYADDTQVYSTFSYDDAQELVETKNRIEMCISDIDNWMAIN